MRKRLVYWVFVLIWCTLIFSITSSPAATSKSTSKIIKSETQASPKTVRKIDFGVRKAAHVTLFGILAVLLLLAFWGQKYAPLFAWFLTTLYGATDEFHQLFETGRTPSVSDVFIDSTGAALALLLFYGLRLIIIKSGLSRL